MSRDAITFPFAVSPRGAVAASHRLAALRQQVEQTLFTIPGERVGRPGFGCAVQRSVFESADRKTAAAIEYVIQAALSRDLSPLLTVDAVRVRVEGATLNIDVLFTARDDGEEMHVAVAHPLEGPP